MPPAITPHAVATPTATAPSRQGRLRGVFGHVVEALPARRSWLVSIGALAYLWAIHSSQAPIAGAAIVLSLVGLMVDGAPVRIPPALWWFAAFLAWNLIGYSQAEYPDRTSAALVEYGKLGLIFLVAINVARTRREWQRFVVCWLAIFAAYPVRGTLLNMMSGISEQGRYAWNRTFSNPNDLATIILPMLALTLALALTAPKGWPRRGAFAGAILLPALIFATQSRGGILALGTMMLFVLTHQRRRLRMLGLALCAAGAVAVAAPAAVWDRLAGLKHATSTEQLGEVDRFGSADQRYEIWKVAAAMTRDHPIFGIGAGGYPKVHAEYAGTSRFRATARGERDTHSMYLNISAESGVVGLLLLMGVILSVALHAWKAIRDPTTPVPDGIRLRMLLIGLIGFLQAAIFDTMGHLPFLYLYLAIMYAAAEASKQPFLVPALAPAPATASPRHQILRRR